jgi:3-oxoacyl-[acyl-carrier-protein] synthase-1
MAMATQTNGRRLAITGLGMVSSVGPDVVTSCASLRAGITRPADTGAEVIDEESLAEVPLLGHPVAGLTDGYEGIARYTRLGSRALRDLLAYAKLDGQPASFWQRTTLAVCVSKARNDELELLDELLATEFPDKVTAAAGVPLPIGQFTVLPAGHASVLMACQLAQTTLIPTAYERCIVLGVDSLLDSAAIEFFGEANRLKSAGSPTGLVPGEAAAAVLLEDSKAAERRGARIEAYIGAVAVESEPANFLSAEPVFGRTLARAMITTASEMQRGSEAYVDLNGEELRAADWGHALLILRSQLGYVPEDLVLPAISLGDTGAASGAVAICAAVRSFIRGFARSNEVLICSSSESGEVATGCVYRA